MASKYKTIVSVGPYQSGIYDGCFARLESNGKRFRTRIDGVLWEGNTGGFHEFRRYLDRDAGRALLRRVRLAQIDDLKGRLNPTPFDVLCGAAE